VLSAIPLPPLYTFRVSTGTGTAFSSTGCYVLWVIVLSVLSMAIFLTFCFLPFFISYLPCSYFLFIFLLFLTKLFGVIYLSVSVFRPIANARLYLLPN
jgi:hypothetical protein